MLYNLQEAYDKVKCMESLNYYCCFVWFFCVSGIVEVNGLRSNINLNRPCTNGRPQVLFRRCTLIRYSPYKKSIQITNSISSVLFQLNQRVTFACTRDYNSGLLILCVQRCKSITFDVNYSRAIVSCSFRIHQVGGS